MIYIQFARFLFPLVLTVVVGEMGVQVLNAGMVRMPRATETLASYGLAWGIINFLSSSLLQSRQLGLVLVDSRTAFRRVRVVVMVYALILTSVLAALALTPLGVWVVEVLHGFDKSLSRVALQALLWLVPVPLLNGLSRFYSGTLIRMRRTDIASAATVARIGASIVTTFALLPMPFVQARPITLPLLVTYAGLLAETAVAVWGFERYVRPALDEHGRALGYGYIVRFFWPLALVMSVQGFSRPLINLFVSRGPGGAEALAVLTVVYALGHLPYGWLNDIRSLPTAFKEQEHGLRYIRRFALVCGFGVFATMVALFWTPLRDLILGTWIGVSEALIPYCRVPLALFAFFPLTVMVRAYLHGVGLVEHRTKALVPSGPARIGAILIALLAFSFTNVHGATRGVAALLSGFTAEAIVVWLGLRGPWQHSRQLTGTTLDGPS